MLTNENTIVLDIYVFEGTRYIWYSSTESMTRLLDTAIHVMQCKNISSNILRENHSLIVWC